MNKEEFKLLQLFYELTNKNNTTLPFTEYTEVITENLELPINTILGLYSSLLEKGYLKNSVQDQLSLTQEGIKEIYSKTTEDELFSPDLVIFHYAPEMNSNN